MNAIQESFTDKLFANYEANVNTKLSKMQLATMEFLQLLSVVKAM